MSHSVTDKSYNVPLLVSNAFDISLFETFLPLLSGGTAIMTSDEQMKDVVYLAEELQHVNAFHAVPALMSQIVNHINANNTKDKYAGIKNLFIGGDAVPTNILKDMSNVFPAADIHVLYGPTESTIFATSNHYSGGEKDLFKGTLIGKPNENRKIYILDRQGQLCPIGVTGEICIGGATLARGYLNQPALTSEKFVPNPFEAGELIYKTGDTGKWLPDGNIEFAGRIDNQVKIRGYRVELGEIESTLENHEDIQSAIVVTRSNTTGDKELVAYIVGKEDLKVPDIRSYLGKTLPFYMVPNYFVQLDALPLTPNGKIDRKILPAPEGMGITTGVEYVAPRNETEAQLSLIWQEILGREKIGIKDNFFDLGGHSLKATRLASHIYSTFEVKIALKDLFSHSTLEDQAAIIQQAVRTAYIDIPAAGAATSYPLSSAQRRLWVLSHFGDGNIAYNMPAVYVFDGALDPEALAASFNSLLLRHESLRTVFKTDEQGNVRQSILDVTATGFSISYHNVRGITSQEEYVRELLQEESRRAFDLSAGPLLRAGLYQASQDKWIFTYTMHHIISDGWSMGILIRELLQLYNAYCRGIADPLTPLRIHYKDYAVWQQSQLKGDAIQEHRNYWQEQLSGALPVLDLPGSQVRPAVKTYNGRAILRHLPAALSERLKLLGQEEGCTLFMSLLSAVNVLLYRYTGQEDIIIGSPIAGREHIDLDGQIGFYVNMLALRSRFSGAESYKSLLAATRKVTLDAYAHQVYPFDELVDNLQLHRDMSRNALFDVLVVLQNVETDVSKELEALDRLSVKGYGGEENAISKYDLIFNFSESVDGIQLRLEYNSDIYDSRFAGQLASHLEQLLSAIISVPGVPIRELDYLSGEEKAQLLNGFNDTAAWYPRDKTVVDLFEEQAARTPDNIAIVFGDVRLSYNELNKQSNQLANYLRQHYEIGPDDLVGMVLERSEWMIISILGILKSGGAYVPVDPEYPQDRIDYILRDSQCKVLVDQQELERFRQEQLQYDEENLSPLSRPADLAYVIYTSGSTGTPKGAMIEHMALTNVCFGHTITYAVTAKDHTSLYVSAAFDVSLWEIFPYLITGASLYVIPKEIRLDIEKLADYYDTNKITISFLPTQIGERFMEAANRSLRYLLIGGDKLIAFAKKGYRVSNIYGPTEATVVTTSYEVNEQQVNIPVGKPISNAYVYILNDQHALCPIGVTGEICIGGDGLARGYVRRPELTAEKFVPDPFKEGGRIYKTGDMGRWLPDGNIEFAGRIDNQVKIRGNRIELGEIESVLLGHEKIEEAVVLAKKDASGEKVLVAYLIGKEQLDIANVRAHLGGTLPAYMLPHHYVQLEVLPLSPNGKVDRKNLPDPKDLSVYGRVAYEAPRNEMEEHLTAVYEEVLKKHPVGIKDGFFVLGGDSIKSMLVVSRLKQRGYVLRIQDILSHPVVEDLAGYMKTDGHAVSQNTVTGIIPLSPVQAFFLNNSAADKHHFNQSVLLRSNAALSVEGMKAILDKIVLHHDALRMVYRETGAGWVQENRGADCGYSFEVIEAADEAAFIAHCERIQSGIDLENGPLFKVALFSNPDGDRLLMVAHHLIMDGISWRILFKDLSDLYQQYMAGLPLTLPLKTHSFKHWQDQQLKYAESEALQKEETYWSAVEAHPVNSLSLDNAGGGNLIKDVAFKSFLLDEYMTTQLLTQCYKAYHTEINDILLTAIGLALAEVAGMARMTVKLEGHGREDIGAAIDVTRTIGWFTTMYPVVFDLRYKQDPVRQLIEMKECLHRVPNKGIGYGILRYLAGKDYKLDPEITFNYLGDFGTGIQTEQGDHLFEFSGNYHGREVSGNRQRDTILDFSGMVADGRMRLLIAYNTAQYAETTIERLLASYQQHLTDLIRRLSTEEKVHVTPVDLTYKGLSMEQLQALSSKLS